MNTKLIAAALLFATLGSPLAMADSPNCGKPQGYGTSNPHIPNASNCGSSGSYSGAAMASNSTAGTKPQGYGTANPYPFNAGSTSVVRTYSDDIALGATMAKKPQGYGTNNPFIFNSGRTPGTPTGN
jgi:hypothetical protein